MRDKWEEVPHPDGSSKIVNRVFKFRSGTPGFMYHDGEVLVVVGPFGAKFYRNLETLESSFGNPISEIWPAFMNMAQLELQFSRVDSVKIMTEFSWHTEAVLEIPELVEPKKHGHDFTAKWFSVTLEDGGYGFVRCIKNFRGDLWTVIIRHNGIYVYLVDCADGVLPALNSEHDYTPPAQMGVGTFFDLFGAKYTLEIAGVFNFNRRDLLRVVAGGLLNNPELDGRIAGA